MEIKLFYPILLCLKHVKDLLHNKKQKLCHVFNIKLRQSSKAFGNLRGQREGNAEKRRTFCGIMFIFEEWHDPTGKKTT